MELFNWLIWTTLFPRLKNVLSQSKSRKRSLRAKVSLLKRIWEKLKFLLDRLTLFFLNLFTIFIIYGQINNFHLRSQNKDCRWRVIQRGASWWQPEEARQGLHHVGGLSGLFWMHHLCRDCPNWTAEWRRTDENLQAQSEQFNDWLWWRFLHNRCQPSNLTAPLYKSKTRYHRCSGHSREGLCLLQVNGSWLRVRPEAVWGLKLDRAVERIHRN